MFSAPRFSSRKHLIPALLLFCVLPIGHAQESAQIKTQNGPTTTVYKVVNPDGSVSFSDQPDARSETLQIEPVPTVPALSPQQINKAYTTQQEPKRASESLYQRFDIVSPADQSAFNSGSGDVSVMLEISPALDGRHQIELRMDNKVIKRGSQTQFTIPTVNRGTHTLQARILSGSGEVLKETTSTFTLHRPSILR